MNVADYNHRVTICVVLGIRQLNLEFVFLACLVSAGGIKGAIQENGGFDAPGLVAYYPFSGDALDHSGNANDLTINRATLTPDRFGRLGSAYSFNGVDAFLGGSDRSLPIGSAPRTVSFWMRADRPGIMFSYGAADSLDAFYTMLHDLAGVGYVIDIGTPTGGMVAEIDKWTHVVATFDGTLAGLHVNGNHAHNPQRVFSTTKTGKLFVGKFVDESGFFKGALDDFRFYNRALTQSEIFELFQLESKPRGPRRAIATAKVLNGAVVEIAITDPGFGYNSTPRVEITDPEGSGATARCVVLNGRVTSITIESQGRDYGSSVRVKIEMPTLPGEVEVAVSKVRVTIGVEVGRRYLLESSFDLKDWAFVSQFNAFDAIWSKEFDVEETGRYYRVSHLP